MATESDLTLDGDRTLHVYDSAPGDAARHVVVWHHGTPNVGAPPEPLVPLSDRLGVRWVSYDRPGYGGSTPRPGRSVGSAAHDTAAVLDSLGVGSFSLMAHSGGGPHALACAALMPDRVRAVVPMSGLAPYRADGLDWFEGMAPAGVASLTAAAEGREAKERHEAADVDLDMGFTDADEAALGGDWSWVLDVVRPALAGGPAPLVDDDLAYVAPWGFDVRDVVAPTLVVHGGRDRVVPPAHGRWLAGQLPAAELWLSPDDGHVSVLGRAFAALEWLSDRSG
ncbi:alpha/beta fold hydrolase [Solicola sp. PLA-1-18]|uniref:alpha/beta fold hydrolase n=1 Tax=Solicola sp. PLA-1-18 TaxID=3380532 RepID=UPI003B7D38FC